MSESDTAGRIRLLTPDARNLNTACKGCRPYHLSLRAVGSTLRGVVHVPYGTESSRKPGWTKAGPSLRAVGPTGRKLDPDLYYDKHRSFRCRPWDSVNSGLLTSFGKTSREALISKELTIIVEKLSVNSRCNRVYKNGIITPIKLISTPADISLLSFEK